MKKSSIVSAAVIALVSFSALATEHYETSDLACTSYVIDKHQNAHMENTQCAPPTIMKNRYTHRYNVSGTDIIGKVIVFKQTYEGRTYYTLTD